MVKSNSCSSRLELAGAEEGDTSTNNNLSHLADTEVVRKMVHHFECNQPTVDGHNPNPNVTINSQSNVGRTTQLEILEATARRQVTVNNHINVMPQESEEMMLMTQGQQEAAATTAATTYHSQAMNIRLELSALGAGRGSDKPNNNSKVCRNRNVDLAYTLAKNPKLPMPQNDGQEESPQKSVKKTCQPEVIGREQIIANIEIHEPSPIQLPPHQERRLSNASSSASTVVDATVVRHYVANDKSIYERRKYDEIEFEEFEIYDPAKEQQQQQQQETEESVNSLDRQSNRQTNDEKLYDSLDDRM